MDDSNPPSPGHFIRELYLVPQKIKAYELAEALKVTKGTVSRLLNDKITITPMMAIKLALVLGRTPESWALLQATWSIYNTKNNVDFKDYTRITALD